MKYAKKEYEFINSCFAFEKYYLKQKYEFIKNIKT